MAPTPMHPRTLLFEASSTGSWVPVVANAYSWHVWGTWNGATAQLEFSVDGGTTWGPKDGVTATEPASGNVSGWDNVSIPAGHVRVSISGAGGSTSLSSDLRGVA